MEDGEDVIEIKCSSDHTYHVQCLTDYLRENEEKGRTEDFECLECH